MKYGFGVDLGGTTVKLAYFDENGTMLDKWEIPTVTANEGRQILPDIAASIADYREKNSVPREQLLGIGIGVPGPVNAQGVVNKCVNLGWGVTDISGQLGALTGLPVVAGNDASVAALGECWKGGGQGCENIVMATLGTGVGGGIVVNGNILHGANGAGGEIGHMVINREETELCGCGKTGCVEQYCSANGCARMAEKALASCDTPSSLRQLSQITCRAVFDAGQAGDPLALQVLDRYFSLLGEFCANLCCVFDPEAIVLGGGVSKAGPYLLEGIAPYFRKYAFHATRNTRFALAELGNDAGAYGAFKLVLDSQK